MNRSHRVRLARRRTGNRAGHPRPGGASHGGHSGPRAGGVTGTKPVALRSGPSDSECGLALPAGGLAELSPGPVSHWLSAGGGRGPDRRAPELVVTAAHT
jgi:hypothetical protein